VPAEAGWITPSRLPPVGPTLQFLIMHPPDDRQPADEWARELQEIRRALAAVPFPTLEAANVFIQERVAGYNARPRLRPQCRCTLINGRTRNSPDCCARC
jgi:hypothetical protein